MFPRQRKWLFLPKGTPTLTCNFTLTTKSLRGCPQQNFLRLLISDSLSWSLYIDHIFKKARRTIGFIHSAFSSAPISVRRIFYLAIVWPTLEYGRVTWHPLITTLTNCLEACQHLAARVTLQSWNLSHENLLQNSDLPLLSKRRNILLSVICTRSSIIYSPLLTLTTLTPGLRSVT